MAATEFQIDCENLAAEGIDATPTAENGGFRISVSLRKEGRLFVHDDLEYDARGKLVENVWSNQDILQLVKKLRVKYARSTEK